MILLTPDLSVPEAVELRNVLRQRTLAAEYCSSRSEKVFKRTLEAIVHSLNDQIYAQIQKGEASSV